ncbi:type II toxin-antitoxin system PemK/MazF family toxin [Mycetocola manganoxydans]|uniref:Type II toxin-antitoxin system PemK/MazF family toxin n=2 Tax=Mycetocola manganoxydans TaxID=699879 RepID=A0A3L6ZXJ2_9MICO|nr:type II toxin-antitoxin system PemK/MazF family toxin [Mycetocola manganoxydans]
MVRSVLTALLRSGQTSTPRDAQHSPSTASDAEAGRSGSHATREIEPGTVGRVRMSYVPSTDGNPDPGEIVWTWVPYEEKDGRGKDRPVLIVATRPNGSCVAVQLTSKPHGTEDVDFVSIGSGNWDVQGRPSWVGIDRIFEVHPDGMRREAAALGEAQFARVAHALGRRYGWR